MRGDAADTGASAIMAFPSGAYGKYKRATAYFLHWLLRARVVSGFGTLEPAGHQTNKSKKKKKPTKAPPPAVHALDEYDRIVAAIARKPTALPEALRRQWPRAMAACESAITLRAHVAQFFPPKTGDDPHMHFLQRLASWFQTLRDANANSNGIGHGTDSRPGETSNFANYYDVLDLPDDFFDDIAEEFEVMTTNSSTVSPSERKRLSEEPFDDDAALELAYLLLELDELVEAVYQAFCDVKRQQKTLVEATVVTDIAVDFARRVVAQFQLHYPHVRNAMDLKTMMLQSTPVEHAFMLTNKVYATWNPTNGVGVGNMPPTYVRGTILLDLLWVVACLNTFSTAIPDRPTDLLVMTEGANGETFSEELTPHYTTPAFFPPMSFFLQQLPLLYNEMVESGQRGVDLDALGFSDFFFKPLVDFFTTREINIDAAFVCVCWARAVSALQGNGGLGRTVSLSVMHRWHLEERVRGSLQKDDDTPLAKDQKIVLSVLKYSDRLTALMRANPLVAGGVLMTNHLNYLHVGTEVSLATTRFRALCHIYSALRDRQVLEAIPLLDELITLYEPALFTPSRAAATHGSFMHVYQLSCSEKARRPKKHNSKHHAEDRTCRCLFSSSKVLQLLSDHDYSVLPTALASTSASSKAQLRGISELCTQELFGSRVLSRDLLKLSNDLVGVFVALRDGLSGHAEFATLAANTDSYLDDGQEDAVVVSLLPMLDTLNLDGSITMKVVDNAPWAQSPSMPPPELFDLVRKYCEHAASIITACFNVNDPSRMERDYYTLPSTPEWVSKEFGDVQTNKSPGRTLEMTTETFQSLMQMMETSTGPLSEDQVATLKAHVIADPALLSMVLPGADVELCSLLHHAAAGRVRDRRLVEWLIQMGALARQPQHFNNPPPVGTNHWEFQLDDLCNTLAVHSAATAGLTDMVRLILEADHLRDINKVTYHTKESLAHIAVRNGDRAMYDLLNNLSANLCHKDATGKYVHDCTSSSKWKREILETVIWQRKCEAEHDARQKQREQEEEEEEEEEDRARQRKATPPSAVRKKAAPSKKKRRPRPVEEDHVMQDAVQQMEELQVKKKSNHETGDTDERIARLTRWLDMLKQESQSTPAERETAVTSALAVVDTIRASVHYFVQSTTLSQFSRDVVRREAADASRVLFLLSKFHRQLPASTRDVATDDSSALGKLMQRAGPASAFDEFLTFTMRTASLLRSCGRLPQAQELLELVERRLLKHKPRDATFRETVLAYLAERRRLSFEPKVGTSADAQRVFKWIVLNAQGFSKLDMLGGYTWFRRIMPLDNVPQDTLGRLYERVATTTPAHLSMLCLYGGDCVVVAAHSSEQLDVAVETVVAAAADSGVHFHAHSHDDNTDALVVDGLELARFALPPSEE